MSNIESGKDDDDSLLIGRAHPTSREEDDVIELDDEDILADEVEEDDGDLDFEPEYDRDY